MKYPPISDYGFISDCHCSALVSREGSVDWCCMPRLDAPSCFGRLVGWENGGYCSIVPAAPFTVTRQYLAETLILETTFRTDQGEAKLLDLFTVRRGGRRDPHQQLLRVVLGVDGEVPLEVAVVPRFDYGSIRPWIKRYRGTAFVAIGGKTGLLISGNIPLQQSDRHAMAASFTVKRGQRARLSILYRVPELLDWEDVPVPGDAELDHRLEESQSWWRSWSKRGKVSGEHEERVRRSALVLKGLSNAQTGAIAAAATTSLPERPRGSRNWDYRFTWIRDSVFTTRSLAQIGHLQEAEEFRRFIERSAAGGVSELQLMFGLGGERRLNEYELDWLAGYRGAKPVRVGNAASRQVQLDMYGELLDLAWRWHQGGQSPDDDYWEFLVELVGEVAKSWNKKDSGIWEVRGARRNFVFSKVLCWSAVNNAINLARDLGREVPLPEWVSLRDRIRVAVEKRGYDKERGVFVQSFEGGVGDAALLRLPMTGFLAFDDPRMVRTVDAIWTDLRDGGLLRRYPPRTDGIDEDEGAFIACSFWLSECLARQGRVTQAQEVFDRAANTANDVGLFSEEYDPRRRKALGNFPQGLTHMSLISAAVALEAEQTGKALRREPKKEQVHGRKK